MEGGWGGGGVWANREHDLVKISSYVNEINRFKKN